MGYMDSIYLDNQSETVSTNKTLDEGDQGVLQVVTSGSAVVTLPSTSAGASYTIVNGGDSEGSAVLVTVSPAAADKIMGNGFTSADNKDAINTLATARVGDMIQLVGDGVDGWKVVRVKGTWAREA